jgi:hypothetical protein
VLSFAVSAQQIAKGDPSTLKWSVKGAAAALLNGEAVPLEGTRVVSPAETTTYRLVAAGPGGTSESREVTVQVGPDAPPAIQFTADSQKILRGQPVTLRWSVLEATHVRIDPDMDSLPAQGDRQVTPQQTTDYALTAEGKGGRVTSHLTVQVDEAPKPTVVSFEAVPGAVTKGAEVQLKWVVKDASHVSIQPEVGNIAVAGSAAVRPVKTSDYVLLAENNSGGKVSRTVTVTVNIPSQPIIQFTGDRPQIMRGESLTLRWSVTESTNVRIDPGFDKLPPQGEMTISPTRSVEYTLTAQGPGGMSSKRFGVRVGPRIAAFEAVPNSIDPCKIAVLRWTVEGASAVTIVPGLGAVSPGSGYKVVRPAQTTRYTLRAENTDGSTTREVVISVSNASRAGCGQ